MLFVFFPNSCLFLAKFLQPGAFFFPIFSLLREKKKDVEGPGENLPKRESEGEAFRKGS